MVIKLSDLIWQRTVSKSLAKTEIVKINLTVRSQERRPSSSKTILPVSLLICIFFFFLVAFLVLISYLSLIVWQSRKYEEREKGQYHGS